MIYLPRVLTAAGEVQHFCRDQGWRSCLIGGVALQRWSEPRLTQDVDMTLLTGFGKEEEFVDVLLKELKPRRPDAREFALSRRVLLAETNDGVSVDIAFGGLPFEERTITRASDWRASQELTLRTCSAEDLVVHKAFAGRDLDWGDVERILTRQHGKLNLPQIRSELKPLLELKGAPEALDKLERMLVTVERRLQPEP